MYTQNEDRRFIGQSSLEKYQGLWIMHLYGDRVEAARQHGELVRDKVNDLAFDYYAHRIDRAIDQSPLARTLPQVSGLAKKIIDFRNFRPLRNSFTSDDRAVAKAFAKGAGLKYKEVLNVIALPDVSQYLLGQAYSGLSKSLGAFGALSALGCSTFVRPSSNEPTGQLIARNLDYEGSYFFDHNAVVIYNHPDPKSKDQAFVNLATLGTPLGVITGHNASGITLTLHQLMVDQLSRKGSPILTVTDEVLRRAHNLEEAVAILKKYKHPSTWRVVLISSKENAALTVETSADGIEVIPMENFNYAVTNTPYAPKMKSKEFATGFNYYADTRFRYGNLMQQLNESPQIDLQKAVDMISSNEIYDRDKKLWRKRVPGGTVGKINNIQSVVFLPEQGIFYMAVAPKLYARPVEGNYIRLPLIAENANDFEGKNIAASKWPSSLKRSLPYDDAAIEANLLFRKAAQLEQEHGKFEEANELLGSASKLLPESAVYPFIRGLNYFLIAWSHRAFHGRALEDLERGMQNFEMAEKLGVTPYHQNIISLFKARYHDIHGDREKAKAMINKIDMSLSKALRVAAKRMKNSPYRIWFLRSVVLDYTNADLFQF